MQNEVVTREEWVKARAGLLRKEKEHTKAREMLAKERQKLPWVRLEKQYLLGGATGQISLSELFLDRSQLAIYHLMFGPGWDLPCVGCTQWANALNCTTSAFEKADARLIVVSHAPFDEINAQRQHFGWNFTWLSSFDSDFNLDFYASSQDTGEDNSKSTGGDDGETVTFDRGENHGVSVFYKNPPGEIFHTYSAYNRGIEELNGAFGYFDILPKGRVW